MAGGFSAWKRAGLKFDRPFVMTPDQSLRYARHTMLPEVGEVGQAKLLQSKVLCLGAGGLGSPAGLYLAAAGVGTIGFVDDDVVDASNLQRQILHATDRVGMPKVESATGRDRQAEPRREGDRSTRRGSTSANVLDIIKDYDLIVDGADNFPTRYLINDAALKLGKPVIDGSIYRFEGTVTTFLPFDGPCYRCFYPEPPPPDMAPSCQEAGVLGVLCGVIGALQATEAIKVLLGTARRCRGAQLRFDALGMKFREFKRPHDPTCPVCGDGKTPEQIELIDYQQFCNVRNLSALTADKICLRERRRERAARRGARLRARCRRLPVRRSLRARAAGGAGRAVPRRAGRGRRRRWRPLQAYRDGATLTPPEESALLIEVARPLGAFVARLFGVEPAAAGAAGRRRRARRRSSG